MRGYESFVRLLHGCSGLTTGNTGVIITDANTGLTVRSAGGTGLTAASAGGSGYTAVSTGSRDVNCILYNILIFHFVLS